ncbi:hypothetical protein Y032_0111g254 [Ancylostoma ceylanicum]|uniref:MADF domain-containing protein n=1 Tax=Ancylostoma ceylanicum TaxID=53326 RepID=A0A016TED6_9BILA|nr:hypothetical protein Y032_0111g254 [Ancylostoma ceylanicum]
MYRRPWTSRRRVALAKSVEKREKLWKKFPIVSHDIDLRRKLWAEVAEELNRKFGLPIDRTIVGKTAERKRMRESVQHFERTERKAGCPYEYSTTVAYETDYIKFQNNGLRCVRRLSITVDLVILNAVRMP